MIIGQEKGEDLDSRIERNFGMMRPEGYRKTDLVTILLNLKIVEQQQEQIKSSEAISSNPKCLLNINKGKKTSRNEKCPATGKKFKQCCGALQL